MITVAVIILLLMLPVLAGYIIYSIFIGSRGAMNSRRDGLLSSTPRSASDDHASWTLMDQANMMHASHSNPAPDVSGVHHSHPTPCDHHQHSHVDTTSHSVDSGGSCGCDTGSSSGGDASSN